MHIDPYTGFITWETGVSPYHVDSAPYPDGALDRPTGLKADFLRKDSHNMFQAIKSTTSPKKQLLDIIRESYGGYTLAEQSCVQSGGTNCGGAAQLTGAPAAVVYTGSESTATCTATTPT